jgi:hypothetical protein
MKTVAAIGCILIGALATIARAGSTTQPGYDYRKIRIDVARLYRESGRQIDLNKYASFHPEQSWDDDSVTIVISSPPGIAFAPNDMTIDNVVGDLSSQLSFVVQTDRDAWQAEIDNGQKKAQSLASLLNEKEQQLAALRGYEADPNLGGGLADFSADGVRQLANAMEIQCETAELDLQAKTARQKALADAMYDLHMRVQDAARNDPVAVELQKVADVRQKELDSLNPRSVSPEMNKAEIALAEAKAAVLERQETVATAAGGDTITAWNRDMISLSVDLAELHARVDLLQKRLKAMRPLISALETTDVASLHKDISDLGDQVNQLERGIHNLEYDLSAPRPTLTVIESYNAKPAAIDSYNANPAAR